MWSGFDFLDTLCKTICTSIYLGVVSLGDRICPAAWLRPCRREVSMTKTRPGLVCSDLQKLIRQAAEPSSGSTTATYDSMLRSGCFSFIALSSASSLSTPCLYIRHTTITNNQKCVNQHCLEYGFRTGKGF